MTVPFLSFDYTNNLIETEMHHAFTDVFNSKWYILGNHVEAFEKNYAAFNKVKHCVGVSNGLDALLLSLQCCDITETDEVIVPSNTYIATVLAVTRAGAIPVFAEPNKFTSNINKQSIETCITAKTKAVIPVHLYGQACEMSGIMELAEKNKFTVIEDNAQAHGALCNSKPTGSWGHVNATSFYPAKNLGALGDAGAVTTNDEKVACKVRMLRNYGSTKKYYNEIAGYNMRLDELQAAFLNVKLKHLEELTLFRRTAAELYDHLLENIDEIKLPVTAPGCTHVYHLYVIQAMQRDALATHLAYNNIGTMIHYPVPPHLQKAYAYLGYDKGAFPVAEELAATSLSLPMYPGITEHEIEYVCDCIKSFLQDRKQIIM